MSPDTLRPRLQLALGGAATLGDELPALRGRRRYAAESPLGARRLVATLHPLPPEGPRPEALQEKVDRLREIGHANIALPVAMGELDGRTWAVDGEDGLLTAEARLRERGALPVREAVQVIRDVARALAAMHRRGLSHGALGLDTVMLAPEGTLLTGLALHEGGGAVADLEALSQLSQALFHGGHGDSAAFRRRLPPEIAALLESMASGDPARRPQRAEAILAVLDTFPVEQASVLGSMVDSAGRGARARGRSATLAVLAIGALILLGVLWLATQR